MATGTRRPPPGEPIEKAMLETLRLGQAVGYTRSGIDLG
jgi:hypothetical protein